LVGFRERARCWFVGPGGWMRLMEGYRILIEDLEGGVVQIERL
jgi:hypothetical protein